MTTHFSRLLFDVSRKSNICTYAK